MENATLKMAKFISELEFGQLSDNTVNKAKDVILDFLGALLACYDNSSALSEKMLELIINNGGRKEASIIGADTKVPLINAAFVNGVLSHVVELDDGHRTAKGHPGVAVLSAALPISEFLGSSGQELITAIVAGYDVFVRIASSVNPSHLKKGFHTTGTCGTFAACAAACNLLKLNETQTANALGLAGIQASGLLEVTIDGQMAKALHAGKAAYSGVLAALLAKEGVEGPKSIIEGNKGFVKALCDYCNYDLMFSDINKKFHIEDCYIKLYPSCRHTHAPVDAILYLMEKYRFKVCDINEIIITTYPTAISFAGEIFKPNTAEEAKFSIAYCLCAALVKGKLSLRELERDILSDTEIRDLTNKVEILSNPELESTMPKSRGAVVTIKFTDGVIIEKRVDLPKGELENPVTKDELIKKFIGCTSNYFNANCINKIVETIFKIDSLDNINKFMCLVKRS